MPIPAKRPARSIDLFTALYLEGENASPHDVVVIMMQPDGLPNTLLLESSLGEGTRDPDLQERCKETDFQDRLTNLTLD